MTAPDEQALDEQVALTRKALSTPRAAAIAGIVFALLFTISMGFMRLAIPEDLSANNAWLQNATTLKTALAFVPFAGIAFLWFMGVVRSHLGRLEDQFFSTVFYGSGLLFLAMMFCSAAMAGGLVTAYMLDPALMNEVGAITYGRAVIYTITNVYAIRMAGVFMLSLGTIWVRTRVMPRFFVILTYVLAVLLLLAINMTLWVIMIFPAWVFTMSVYILIVSLRGKPAAAASAVGEG